MNVERKPRVALVTCAALPMLYEDEQALPAELAALGIEAEPVIWSDLKALDGFDVAVIRSTWDYFERIDEFRAWLSQIDRGTVPVLNSAALVRWNLDKAYLLELSARGVPIVETCYFVGDIPFSLAGLLAEKGWERAVVKPAISGGAYRTYLVDTATAGAHDVEANALRREVGVLVQPYLEEIAGDGEWSLLYFDGAFSHAVVKTPKPRDFRVQSMFGGTSRAVIPPPAILAAGERVLRALPESPLYARVDGVVRKDGTFALMEVELIEPYLYCEGLPGALGRYAASIARAATSMKHR